MRIGIIAIILVLSNLNLIGQNNETKRTNPIEIKLKVWQETEKGYKQFIKKQTQLRKKLDKHIEPQDLEKLKILRKAYYNNIAESERKGELIPEIRKDESTPIFVESWKRMNDRFKYQIRAHEILNPILLRNKELYEIAEYLSNKYDKQIEPIKKKIGRVYQKFKKKERKVYLKYNEDKQENKRTKKMRMENSNSKRTNEKLSGKSKVFSNSKILIMKSENKIQQ